MTNIKKIIQHIKVYLKQSKMTQEQLAHEMGIAPSLLSQILNGTRKLQTQHILQLSKIMHQSVNELAENDPNEFKEPVYSLRGQISTQAGKDHLTSVIMDIEHYLILGDEKDGN